MWKMDNDGMVIKKAVLAILFILAFSSTSYAEDDQETLVRDVTACSGLDTYYEYSTSVLNGRRGISDRFLRLGAYRRFRKGLSIVIDSDASAWPSRRS